MRIKVGMVGAGAFAQSFIPLFKAHPLVEEVVLCDLDADKLRRASERHGIARTCPSLDELCGIRVDAAVLITQPWLHAAQAAQALRAGKHVYCAVPIGSTLDEVAGVVRAVEETGRIYMTGETSYYYPETIYCRQQYARGAFGHVVYGEAEYYHDWDHGLYDVARWRGGDRWREFAGQPPMMYPTHSTSMVISVTGARMTHVSGQGIADQADDGIYRADANRWGNVFSDESALFRMSDGSTSRINEFRRIGHPGTVRLSLFGTEGTFERHWTGAAWLTKDRAKCVRLDDLLECREGGFAAVHPIDRLPTEFEGLPNSHSGSHQFLVDDFVRACAEGTQPPNHVWAAARYAIPGIVAHDSAMRGGELLAVPDLGPGPDGRSQ